jgi:hypothetical protein
MLDDRRTGHRRPRGCCGILPLGSAAAKNPGCGHRHARRVGDQRLHSWSSRSPSGHLFRPRTAVPRGPHRARRQPAPLRPRQSRHRTGAARRTSGRALVQRGQPSRCWCVGHSPAERLSGSCDGATAGPPTGRPQGGLCIRLLLVAGCGSSAWAGGLPVLVLQKNSHVSVREGSRDSEEGSGRVLVSRLGRARL